MCYAFDCTGQLLRLTAVIIIIIIIKKIIIIIQLIQFVTSEALFVSQ